jgi:hypothetical protein
MLLKSFRKLQTLALLSSSGKPVALEEITKSTKTLFALLSLQEPPTYLIRQQDTHS